MLTGKGQFITGFVLGSLLCGSAAVFAVGELYTPKSGGNWIRDALVYAPDTADQINVLADIQPGAAVLMQEVGLRLNALNSAGKKQNWEFAAYEAHEIGKALEKLKVTRPALATTLTSFITNSVAPVEAAATAADKATFQTTFGALVDACTSCHVDYDMGFLVVKPGKSAFPIQ